MPTQPVRLVKTWIEKSKQQTSFLIPENALPVIICGANEPNVMGFGRTGSFHIRFGYGEDQEVGSVNELRVMTVRRSGSLQGFRWLVVNGPTLLSASRKWVCC